MTMQLPVHQVKQLVVRTFVELGAAHPALFGLKESHLVNAGRRFAHVYEVHGARAIWFMDRGVVRFLDSEGTLLRTVNLFETMVPQTAAA